ncbi:DUF3515 family protein [Streptomyces sp. MS06]|uniref:DUF3515 family protein n=1 Tax=Streptomyces sp. MS06 TaxID=3385974 RepID=UPI00399FCB7D
MESRTNVADRLRRAVRGVRRPRRLIVVLAAVLALAVAAVLVVNDHRVAAAPHAADPRCAKVVDRAPGSVRSASRDWTIGRGVVSWGGGRLVLRCGVNEPGPTGNLCLSADDVDWVLDEKTLQEKGVSVLRTYGRSPAVEVDYSGPRENVGGILASLADSVDWIPQHSKCLGLGDTL